MTFLAPWALWAAGAVSAAVIALHILASKNPRVTALPTTRFIPDVPLRATARAMKLSDVALLLLRVAVVMLAGVAFARPVLTGARRAVGRVVMVDRSATADHNSLVDSVHAYFSKGDKLFVFDSAAYDLQGELRRFGIWGGPSEAHGSLSVALAAAMRAASSLRGEADSVEIVLVSPFDAQEIDAATSAIRAAWPGRVRLVRVSAVSLNAPAQTLRDVRGAALDDPLGASLSFVSHLEAGRGKTDSVRIERGSIHDVDTTSTRAGLTLVRWPVALDSSGYPQRTHHDTAGAVIAGRGAHRSVVVAPFVRAVDPPAGRVVARWADGSAAATERKVMNGCVRDVAIPLPRAGDLVLRESTRRLVAALSQPCSEIAAYAPLSDSSLAQLRGSGSLVATRALETSSTSSGKLATWLLGAALVLLLLEPLLRRQRASA